MEKYIIKRRDKHTGQTVESSLLNTKEEAQGWVKRMNETDRQNEYWYETTCPVNHADVPF